jgi:galactose mutarotase-like enzyme
MPKVYTLLSPDKSSIIQISSQGAQILSYRINDKKIFHEDAMNPRRAGMPIMFPFAGPLKDNKLTLTGTKLPQHGFGRDIEWQVYQIVEKEDFNVISFAISNADLPSIWQNNYPFPFILMVHYYLSNDGLDTDLIVMNPLQEDMQVPVKPGFHPFFEIAKKDKPSIKLSKGNEKLKNIDWATDFPAEFIDNNDGKIDYTINGIKFKTSTTHRIYKLSEEHNETILDLNEKTVIWSQPDTDYVCIEPISGPFNSINYNPILVQKGQGYQFRYRLRMELEKKKKSL